MLLMRFIDLWVLILQLLSMNTGFVIAIVATTCIYNYINSFRIPFKELPVLQVATISWKINWLVSAGRRFLPPRWWPWWNLYTSVQPLVLSIKCLIVSSLDCLDLLWPILTLSVWLKHEILNENVRDLAKILA